MNKLSKGFLQISNNVLTGVLGNIDGWLVHIQKPSHWFDSIKNPAKFFSHKDFYALNVQCIVDQQKKSTMGFMCSQRTIT